MKDSENRVKRQIKQLLLNESYNIKELVQMLNDEKNYNDNPNNFYHRLTRGSVTYHEMLDIADVLGYKIRIEKD